MHSTPLLLALLSALVASKPITHNNTASDPLIITFWKQGCHGAAESYVVRSKSSNHETFFFTTDPNDGYNNPGDCVESPFDEMVMKGFEDIGFGYDPGRQAVPHSVEVVEDVKQSYKVEMFVERGCETLGRMETRGSCYAQLPNSPYGANFMSVRASIRDYAD